MNELKSPFDNLPFLSQEEALKILATPISELALASDYYKAAFHLGKFPGAVTEQALLYLVESTSNEQPVVIARKKAIEGLARLRCVEAIPAIGSCLSSSDPYLVETSAWALQELDCQDPSLHQVMTSLLEDPNQHRRVLIQSLTSLGVVSALPSIERLQDDASPGVSGAAMAAVFKLCGQRQRLA
ncbi:MAG TPA: HEAT repeat domain-containing protein, partial [Prochlorococcaceae cyanobacterium Fu_MAG_72]|nr:HEAT repeat domain-containing protein [Prochlorococcaceae cyanobacterium Fu_MAG_72]